MENISKVILNKIIHNIIYFIKEKGKFKFIIIILSMTFNSCYLLKMFEDAFTRSAVDIKGAFLLAGQSNMEGNPDTNLYNNTLNKITTQNGSTLQSNLEETMKDWYMNYNNGYATYAYSDTVITFQAQELVRLKKANIVGSFLKTARSDVWCSFNSNTVSGLKDGFGKPIGPELTLGQYLGNKANSSISLIKLAYGGTTLYDDWVSPSAATRLRKSTGPLYIELKNKIKSIKSNPDSVNPDYSADWQGFIWLQGENDCFDQINAQTYKANLRDLIKDVRNEIGNPNLPVIIVELNYWAQTMTYGEVVKAAQNAVAASDPNIELVKINDLSQFFHMDPAAHFILGERIGKSIEKLLTVDQPEVDQPEVDSGPAGYTWCANEGSSFTLPGNSDVAYGANGKYTYLYNKTGTITFNNSTFGDPIIGVYKAGYYKLHSSSSENDFASGYYKISVKHSGKYLDVSGVSKENGAIIHQWDWWNGDNQKWYLEPQGNGYYKINAKHSGKCLDVYGGWHDDGADIIQWQCHAGDNQIFRIVDAGGGYYNIKAKHSGKCLDVSGEAQDNGGNFIQWPCHGRDNQKFSIVNLDADPGPDSTPHTLTVNNGSGDGNYKAGTLVNIKADAAPSGKVFVRWTINNGNSKILTDTSPRTVLTMGSDNTTITATYRSQNSSGIARHHIGGYNTAVTSGGFVPSNYDGGFSMYVAAWRLFKKYPGYHSQTGLLGTWMFSNGNSGKYSDIEGGLGWWRNTRFTTETPKFIMGGVALDFSEIANGPGAGAGDWNNPKGLYGVAQLSPWVLFPPDGLNLRDGASGELFGYGYLPLPLTDPKNVTAGKNVVTGNNCWTLFLNTDNFKGPVAFFLPYFWSKPSVSDPSLSGIFLDSQGSRAGGSISMETQHLPVAQAKSSNGRTYVRVAPILFPSDEDGNTILINSLYYYDKSALWNSVENWFNGGSASNGYINSSNYFHRTFSRHDAGWSIWENAYSGGPSKGVSWDNIRSSITSDPYTVEIKWNRDLVKKELVNGKYYNVFPEYFVLENNTWKPISASQVPTDTGLKNYIFDVPVQDQPAYTTPTGSTSAWKKPGPVAGPYYAYPHDGSKVTYYWYRFADQPSMLKADLTNAEREKVQKRVEKIHRNWTKNKNYLAPPALNKPLAGIDPALIVQPPAGLEAGYVPIVTRQEWAN